LTLEHKSGDEDQEDSCDERADVDHVVPKHEIVFDLWNQIRRRDVDEVARCK